MRNNWIRYLHLISSAEARKTFWERRRFKREYARLERLPRYQPTTTDLLGLPLQLPDAASFLWTHWEIFTEQIYAFEARNARPRIIDGGANIGLSILYFKQLYPASHIVAFEPDPQLFSLLRSNVHRISATEVELVNAALWMENGNLPFMVEGADGGRIAGVQDTATLSVPTVRLREYLGDRVDLLKLDIEGAETEVLLDCGEALHQVDRLYVEYHSFTDQRQTLPDLLEVLRSAGFRLHLLPVKVSPQPFLHRKESLGMDLQLHIFGYRPEAG